MPSVPSMPVSEEEGGQSEGLVAGNMTRVLEVCVASHGCVCLSAFMNVCLTTRSESRGASVCRSISLGSDWLAVDHLVVGE